MTSTQSIRSFDLSMDKMFLLRIRIALYFTIFSLIEIEPELWGRGRGWSKLNLSSGGGGGVTCKIRMKTEEEEEERIELMSFGFLYLTAL